jgi:hypothetical protein
MGGRLWVAVDRCDDAATHVVVQQNGAGIAIGGDTPEGLDPAGIDSADVTPSGSFAAMCTVSMMSRMVARSRSGSDSRSRTAPQNCANSRDSLLVMGSSFGSAPAVVAGAKKCCARGAQAYLVRGSGALDVSIDDASGN